MAEIGIIIPSYNHAHYLPYALRSILAQTFSDWEVIIVDDGSTDDTRQVAAQFADPRIRYIYQKNQGLSAARNAGIQTTDATYLAFLDADDEWETDFLPCCADALKSDRTLGGVYTLTYFIDDQGTRLPQIGGQMVAPSAFRSLNLEGGFFPINAALIRSDCLKKAGLFDTQLTSEEDWDFWIRVSEHCAMRGIPVPLARYRVRPGSMSTNAARMHQNRMSVLAKYFGPLDNDPQTWSEEKRKVYAFAYRSTAYHYLQQKQPEEGWRFMAQAISTWPPLLERVDTFYELACADQPYGFRGQADQLNLSENGARMLRGLDALFERGSSSEATLRHVGYGNAYLALAMLSEQTGRWSAARRYLVQAIVANPRLVASPSVRRRLVKLVAGQRLVGYGRALANDRRRVSQTVHPSGAQHESQTGH